MKEEDKMSNPQNSSPKNLRVTRPMCTAMLSEHDIHRTLELQKCIEEFNIFELGSEYYKLQIISKIGILTQKWIKTVSAKMNKSADFIKSANAKIYPFGSYRMGVQTKGSDIDLLCIVPRHVSRTEYFTSFVQLFKEQKEVKDLRAIEKAFVPVIKMTFDGIEVDLLFARLALEHIPNKLDLHTIEIRNLDYKCVLSLNGRRVSDAILSLVKKKESFCLALRSIKLWAKKQGIYSNVLGYLGGVSWAMLVAKTCQLYPNASAATLVHKFFFVFSTWHWPTPVLLSQLEKNDLKFYSWDPQINKADRHHLMPIITPVYPHINATYNVTVSSKTILQNSFKNGLSVSTDIINGKSCWNKLFEPINFFPMYKHFIVFMATSSTEKDNVEWCGTIQSKIRSLISCLEKLCDIGYIHVNPERFTPLEVEPDTFQTMWFLGIQFQSGKVHLDLGGLIHMFKTSVIQQATAIKTYRSGMKIDTKYVQRKDLCKFLPGSVLGKGKNENVLKDSNSKSLTCTTKKRPVDKSENCCPPKKQCLDLV